MDRFVLAGLLVAAVVIVSIAVRLISRRRHALPQIDPAELAGSTGPNAAVIFTSPYCHGCKQWIEQLGEAGVSPLQIDIAQRPDAAARYRINATPRIAVVRVADGAVLREFTHYTPRAHDIDAVRALAGSDPAD